MAQHRSDYNISKRCYEFLIEKYGSVKKIIEKTRIPRSSVYEWMNGDSVPGAYYLQYLCELGADIKFILTGKKG